MKERKKYFYKNDENIQVYQYLDNDDSIYKKYIDNGFYKDKEKLKLIRQKLMAIKNSKNWPEFVVKPKSISRLNERSFIVEYPYIKGIRLDDFLRINDLNLLKCAKFISDLEEKIMHENDFVFPDIANYGNIMILLGQEKEMNFLMIDPDDIQFGKYNVSFASGLLGVNLNDKEKNVGVKKCIDEKGFFNKQLDVRSMFALFYSIMNGDDYLYPVFHKKSMDEYCWLLKSLNIPSNSSLYNRTLVTLSDEKPNELISDSLFELIDDGYELEVYDKNREGNQYRLIRDRKPFFTK